MVETILLWGGFTAFILIMIAVDLFVHRHAHVIQYREALLWSAIWIALSLLFCVLVYWTRGPEAGLNFLTGYLIEKALSVDNLFVFLMIFSYFAVPPQSVHKVLFWGVVGALVMRAIFIFAGIVLLHYFHWLIYVFGLFLMYAAIHLARENKQSINPAENPVIKLLRRFMPITEDFVQQKFFVKHDKRYIATPLFVCLVAIETTDIIFALDSVPAILAITQDPFIVYSSNVFAILGLRALYFLLSALMQLFVYLQKGLALLLFFIGTKMVLSDIIHIPIGITLAVVLVILVGSIGISLLTTKKNPKP